MVVRTSGSGRPERVERRTSPVLQAYVDGIPLPAALLDERGRIQGLNHAWEDLARPGALVAPTDRVGADHLHDLRAKGFQRDAGRGLAQVVEAVAAGHRRSARYEYELQGEASSSQWEASITGLDMLGQRHVLLVHRDRSAEARAGDGAQRVADLLLEREHHTAIERDRQRLLQAGEQAFHAPMTPIRLQLHMLRSQTLGPLTQRQQDALERVERNVHRWWNLQDSFITELKALETSDREPDDADAVHLLDEALQPFNERALKAGVRLRVDRSQEPLHVRVDRRGIVQVFMLLLDHAIRQTPSGGLVWVRMRNLGSHAELVIQDQDPVMDPEYADALLAAEAKESSLRSGLLHARSVLQGDRGSLEARCAGPGQGLEVCLRIPLA